MLNRFVVQRTVRTKCRHEKLDARSQSDWNLSVNMSRFTPGNFIDRIKMDRYTRVVFSSINLCSVMSNEGKCPVSRRSILAIVSRLLADSVSVSQNKTRLQAFITRAPPLEGDHFINQPTYLALAVYLFISLFFGNRLFSERSTGHKPGEIRRRMSAAALEIVSCR